jgi:hypothetical protein
VLKLRAGTPEQHFTELVWNALRPAYSPLSVARMGQLQCVPHPSPAATGQDHSPLHLMERISRMRNRMRESCSSGSVGGEGGNRLA